MGNNKWQALCPAHNDKTPSLSITLSGDKWLLYCHAGCNTKDILKSVNLKESDLFMNNKHTNKTVQHCNTNNNDINDDTSKSVQQCNTSKNNNNKSSLTVIDKGCTLLEYSEFKNIPEVFLKTTCFLNETVLNKKNALLIPYSDEFNKTVATRYRISLNVNASDSSKFIWKKGDKPFLYGLWKLKDFQKDDFIIIVEGESDCHTLWYNDFPAIGVPGATNWKKDRDAVFFNGFNTIYLIKEPDTGGDKLIKSLSDSSLKDRIKVVSLGEYKDPSELYIKYPKSFKSKFQKYLDASQPLKDYQSEDVKKIIEDSWKYCEIIARQQKILTTFAKTLSDVKIAGEIKLCKLIYLGVTTRFFDKPVSITIRGVSSSGKSYTSDSIIKYFFPPKAVYSLSSMSEKALIYTDEDFKHRFILIQELSGLPAGFGQYIVRSLLSEGRIKYEVTEADSKSKQHKTRKIEKEGPTGLILTTTSSNLNPENENRSITVYTDDSLEQTKRVLFALSENVSRPDTRPWIDFQTWLSFNVKPVEIPYTTGIINNMNFNDSATRIRRDYVKLISLIRHPAKLHKLIVKNFYDI
jgi:hypothetical protein